ncbi:MAG: helix-turn-helix domain-containing protein [Verrucomicrobiae bacterium]|nr:helix-turn-helix domain-containing protein [Verrucomicrobiae bacterium]
MSDITTPHERPEWAPATTITRIYGISRSSLYELAAAGKIRSSSLRKRGRTRGKRLFSTDSVAAFIEAHASGGDESKAPIPAETE